MMRKHAVLLRLLPVLIVLIPQSSFGQSTHRANPIRAVIGTGGGSSATDGEWGLQGTVGQSAVGIALWGEVKVDHGFWSSVNQTTSLITSHDNGASSGSALQNFPDPFNLTTTIHYTVSERSMVNLSIYDMSGRFVRALLNEELQPGEYQSNWSGEDASGNVGATGFYVCLLDISPSESTAEATKYREIISFVR